MKRLSKRTSKRRITRLNGSRAIRRIEAELRVLIDQAPTKSSEKEEVVRQMQMVMIQLMYLYRSPAKVLLLLNKGRRPITRHY